MILLDAINYIENHLFEEIDYDGLARYAHTNKYNLMRIFSASTDFTLAEYIRLRRLSEAGRAISETKRAIIDIGFDCGYTTAESFSKAYKKFHGISPSETRKTKRYKFIHKWSINHLISEGKIMKYEIAEFKDAVFYGYGERFAGKAENRGEQDEKFVCSTRKRQDALRVLRKDGDCDWWEILDNFGADGFDLFVTVRSDDKLGEDLDKANFKTLAEKTEKEKYDNIFDCEKLKRYVEAFTKFVIGGKYAKFVSEYREFPMGLLDNFTKSVYGGIDEYGFTRDESRPELLCVHWAKRANIKERHLELYLPIK